jgi:FK506-binding protein 1
VGKPKKGDVVKAHYTGRLMSSKHQGKKGEEFEDTYYRQVPAKFLIGQKQLDSSGAPPAKFNDPVVMRGLHDGVEQMLLGEKAQLEITSDFAYGIQGMVDRYGKVPPNSNVILEVELMQINDHRRKQPKDESSCCMQILHTLFRFY